MVRRLAGSEHQGQPDPPPYPHPPNLAEEESRDTKEINWGQIHYCPEMRLHLACKPLI